MTQRTHRSCVPTGRRITPTAPIPPIVSIVPIPPITLISPIAQIIPTPPIAQTHSDTSDDSDRSDHSDHQQPTAKKKESPDRYRTYLRTLQWERRLPTLPILLSTIGAIGLNCSVRNGKRWIPNAITTLMGRHT